MKLEELLKQLEIFLCNENPYAILSIFRDRQTVVELYDMLKELFVYRAREGKDKVNEPLPDYQLGKATVRKKVPERGCTTYGDALRHIEEIFDEYNRQAFEHREDGFPMIYFDCEKKQSDYGGMILNYNFEVRLRKQVK